MTKTIQFLGENLLVVGLSGPSSSGKSITAKALHEIFDNSILVHLDDFYYPDEKIPHDSKLGELNWDCQEAIDYDKFIKHIEVLRSKKVADESLVSLEIEPDLKLEPEEINYFKNEVRKMPGILSKTIVLVDGFMLYHSSKVLKLFDVKLFFRASFETLKARREARQGYNTVSGFWVDPPDYFTKIVWPEYVKNHEYLFKDNDVTKSLNDYATKQIGIRDIMNEDLKLHHLISWAINEICKSGTTIH